jgi:segregation and condensation protein A
MQKASQQILALPQLGVDIFPRGLPETFEVEEKPVYYLPLYDLLSALSAPMRRKKPEKYAIHQDRLYSLEESASRLRRILGHVPSWSTLMDYLPQISDAKGIEALSAVASTFAATLELVKSGELELRQDGTFAPIYLRRREPSTETTSTET